MRGSIENMHSDVGVSRLNDKDSKQEVLIKKKKLIKKNYQNIYDHRLGNPPYKRTLDRAASLVRM